MTLRLATIEAERTRTYASLYGPVETYETVTLEVLAEVDLAAKSVEIVSVRSLEVDGWVACGLEGFDRREIEERFLEDEADSERRPSDGVAADWEAA